MVWQTVTVWQGGNRTKSEVINYHPQTLYYQQLVDKTMVFNVRDFLVNFYHRDFLVNFYHRRLEYTCVSRSRDGCDMRRDTLVGFFKEIVTRDVRDGRRAISKENKGYLSFKRPRVFWRLGSPCTRRQLTYQSWGHHRRDDACWRVCGRYLALES